MNKLSYDDIIKALLEEIATADGFAQPDEMNRHTVKISKIGWGRILKYAHALGMRP